MIPNSRSPREALAVRKARAHEAQSAARAGRPPLNLRSPTNEHHRGERVQRASTFAAIRRFFFFQAIR